MFIFAFVWKNSGDFYSIHIPDDSSRASEINDVRQFRNHFNRAEELRQAGEYRAAAARYTDALKINKSHEGALYNLGNVNLFLKNFEQAEENWLQLVGLNQSSARAWLQLGTLYFCLDNKNSLFNPERAADHFSQASELSREDTGPRLHLSKIAILNNQYNKAVEELESVISQNFMSYQSLFLRGYLYWINGESESAFKKFKESAELYHNLSHITLHGEGGTAAGAKAMLYEEMFCDFMGNRISAILENQAQTVPEKLFRQFDDELNEWRNKSLKLSARQAC